MIKTPGQIIDFTESETAGEHRANAMTGAMAVSHWILWLAECEGKATARALTAEVTAAIQQKVDHAMTHDGSLED
jgi:hypothetical protein